jgi:hypothetical protein
VLGRIPVKAHDGLQFFGKADIPAELKVLTRCGLRSWACQMRGTLASLMLAAAAMVRVLQGVAPAGRP